MSKIAVTTALRALQKHGPFCPCCQKAAALMTPFAPALYDTRMLKYRPQVLLALNRPSQLRVRHGVRSLASATTSSPHGDYAFEMMSTCVRFGKGVTREVGMDLKESFKASHVAVFADPNLAKLVESDADSPVSTVLQSLQDNGVKYSIFTDISIEPTDRSINAAAEWAKEREVDAFVAVGGGSTIDTAKFANLMVTYPQDDFMYYVNAPIGGGGLVPGPLKPLIAVPTTAGTGSETTGTIVFDLLKMGAKTGISNRHVKPSLGLVDVNNTRTLPQKIVSASGFDVMMHSIESYTALPYNERLPVPKSPAHRPLYQGSNPIADGWSLKALEMCAKNLPIAFSRPEDEEARGQMLLASTMAGVGFGSAGCHAPHGMSYAPSSLVKKRGGLFHHGFSVVTHAPAVFSFTAVANPQRHALCAQLLGSDVSSSDKPETIGKKLAESILHYMKMLDAPLGLDKMGITKDDIPFLVENTLPQERVTKLSPRPLGAAEFEELFNLSFNLG